MSPPTLSKNMSIPLGQLLQPGLNVLRLVVDRSTEPGRIVQPAAFLGPARDRGMLWSSRSVPRPNPSRRPVDSSPSSPSAVLRLDPSSCRPSLPPPVFPRRARPPLTLRGGWRDLSGSHSFLAHMIWSPTPGVRRRLAMPATTVLPSAIKAASARAMRFISWPITVSRTTDSPRTPPINRTVHYSKPLRCASSGPPAMEAWARRPSITLPNTMIEPSPCA
jgi:hypothetical protein